jgi:hypothetical protein
MPIAPPPRKLKVHFPKHGTAKTRIARQGARRNPMQPLTPCHKNGPGNAIEKRFGARGHNVGVSRRGWGVVVSIPAGSSLRPQKPSLRRHFEPLAGRHNTAQSSLTIHKCNHSDYTRTTTTHAAPAKYACYSVHPARDTMS